MTATFWILATALVALALALLLWPLLRRRVSGVTASRRALNTAVYRDQIADLDRDRASGALSEGDFAQAHEELQRRLLEDVLVADAPAPPHHPRAVRTSLLLLIAVPMLATLLYGWLGNPAGLQPQTATRHAARQNDSGDGGGAGMMAAGGGEAAGGSAAAANAGAGDLAQLAAGLAAKLEKKPDPQGFAMLGRTYKALGRYDDAEKAFKRAGSIMDTDPTLILEQAELGAIRNGGRLEGKPLAAIQKVLKMQPDNPQALLLAGSAAYFNRDFANAVSYWERLRKQVKPGSEDFQALTSSIDKARSQMSGGGSSMAAALGPVLADPSAGSTPSPATPAAAAPSGAGATLSGRIEIAAAYRAKASPGDTVFIFARAAQGPRMPLAIKRVHVSDLPTDFTLDDSMAMSPEFKLSNFAEVNVGARISKTGNAMPQPGDLRGTAGPFKPGAKAIKLTIDDVVP
jgi:cytochrome c-type biogenesis protein CcmH